MDTVKRDRRQKYERVSVEVYDEIGRKFAELHEQREHDKATIAALVAALREAVDRWTCQIQCASMQEGDALTTFETKARAALKLVEGEGAETEAQRIAREVEALGISNGKPYTGERRA